MKKQLQYGSSVPVPRTKTIDCVEIACAIRKECDQRSDIHIFWVNDWIIVEGETLYEVATTRIWKIVFDCLRLKLGYTEDQCRSITVHNKLTLLGKENKKEE